MVATLVIHVITWITTHLPTPEGWKAELADTKCSFSYVFTAMFQTACVGLILRLANHRLSVVCASWRVVALVCLRCILVFFVRCYCYQLWLSS